MKSGIKSKSHFSRLLATLMTLCLLVAYLPTVATAAEEQPAAPVSAAEDIGVGLKVGASVKDITPTNDMLPIHAGNARMGLRLVGVIEGLNVRVIAMRNDGGPISLIVNVETGKGPYPPDFIKWLSEATGVAETNIFWSATHVHSAPEITDANWKTMQDSFNATTGKNEGRYENLRKWGYLIRDQLIAAAKEAIANMVDAEVGIGYTKSYINVNRTTKYVDAVTGAVTYAEGFNGDGPSDKTLTTIRYQARDTKEPIAFIVHYAMHLTSLYGNQYYLPQYASVNGFAEADIRRDDTLLADADIANNSVGIHPDMGGLVARYIEAQYPGAAALWISGAAGNQNPIFRNNMIFASPATGLKIESNVTGACIAAVEYYSSIQFVDVKRALASITEFKSDMPITHAWGGTQLPNKTEGGNPINMYLSVMRMGDITFAGSPSELYNGIGVAMREGSLSEHTLVVNHCWTHAVEATGYYPDDLTLETGSDKTASYKTGTINSGMTNLLNKLYLEAEPKWTYSEDGTAKNIATGESVIVGLDGIAGTPDDNRVINPAGKTLIQNATVEFGSQNIPYVNLGNGFNLYGGEDGKIGTGDDVVASFGSYAQSDATGAEKEPIDWRLLDIKDDGATAVLIASQCLDAAYFNLEANKASNAWNTSNLRSWLNSRGGKAVRNTFSSEADPGFYDTAFTADEKAKINLTNVKMDYSEDAKWDPGVFVRPEGYATYNNTTGTYPAYDTVWFAQINASNPNEWTGNGNNPSNKNSPWILTTTTGESTQDYVYAISGEEYFEYFGKAWVVGDGWDLINYRNGYFRASAYASARGAKTSPTAGLPFPIVDNLARSPGRPDLLANGVAYGVFWSGTGSMNVGRPVYGSPTEANIAKASTYGIIPMINVDLSGKSSEPAEGATVKADPASPTGYTATFVYKDAEAENVYLQGDAMYFADAAFKQTGRLYTPYEWQKGMFPISGLSASAATTEYPYTVPATPKYNVAMTKTENDTWTVTVPLPSGAYKYCYYVNGNGSPSNGTKVLDPANLPLRNSDTGEYANFSIVYMPFDARKQIDDRSITLPRDGQNGRIVFETFTEKVTGTNKTVPIAIYLPYGYDENRAEPYKVFYLSHGGGGHERDWTNDGTMPNIMDKMIANGRLEPTIVVAVNFSPLGNDHTVMAGVQKQHVVPLLESKYNASTKVADRAYAGLSRGGEIAGWMMVDACKDPENNVQYGTWGIWSARDVPTTQLEALRGDAKFMAELKKLKIIVDTGFEDEKHYRNSVALVRKLDDMGAPVYALPTYVSGGHDWMLWPKLLESFAENLWKSDDISLTSTVAKIVAGYAANVPVSVTPAFSGDVSIYAPNGNLLYTKNLLNEKSCLFSLKASEAVAGTYTIKAGIAEATIACVAAPTDLWAPVVTVADGKTVVTFAAAVAFNDAKKGAKIGAETVSAGLISAEGNTVAIAKAASPGQSIVISGVKYAELFPSYSFTFTLTYTA